MESRRLVAEPKQSGIICIGMSRSNLQVELAVVASLLLHLLLFGTWQNRHVLSQLPLFSALARAFHSMYQPLDRTQPPTQTVTFIEVSEPDRQPERREPGRTFMETTDAQVTGEEPKEAKYYSDKSTVAANPENPTGETGDTPYLDGTETRVMSTENVPPQPAAVLPAPSLPPPAVAQPQPAIPPQPEPPKDKPAEEEPKEIADQGSKLPEEKKLAMLDREIPAPAAPPAPATPPPDSNVPQTSRPVPVPPTSGRDIVAVKSRIVATGAFRSGIAAFNVAASPFGAYDQKIIRAVQSRWYALIEKYAIYERAGEVELNFQLYDDGTVHNMEVKENTAGEILRLYCEKAIVDSAPFDVLPDQLRTLIGKEPREVNFTFYY